MTVDRCPITAAQAALTLLRSGRAAMAQHIMEGLPTLIEAALARGESGSYLRGQADAQRILAAASERQQAQRSHLAPIPPAPRKPSRLEWLRDALADPSQRERARAALRMEDWLLDRIAAGTATLSGAYWRRVREALT
jgi:hypothetical protein